MAQITVAPLIPVGTAGVAVYPRSAWGPRLGGAPSGSATASSLTVASNGTVTATLAAGSDYVAYRSSPETFVAHTEPSGSSVAGASLFVAASNASAKAKAHADYVCSGSADETTINAALASLPTSGGTVTLSEGTFTLAASIQITASNVRLVGQGANTSVKIAGAITGQHIIFGNPGGSAISILQGVHVANLTVFGYGDNQNTGALDNGVHLAYCNNSTVENIWGHDVKWAVVSLHDCQRCVVDRVHIQAGTLGVSGGWYGVSVDNPDTASNFAGHVISNITSEAPHHAVAMQSVNTCRVTNVVATSMLDTGGDPCVLNWQDCSNITASGIVGINVPGLLYIEKLTGSGCDRCSLTDFTATITQTTGHPAIFVSNSSNTLVSGGYLDCTNAITLDGIYVDTTSTAARITHNTILNAARCGVQVDAGANGSEVSFNTITGSRGTGASDAGVRVNSASQVSVIGNRIESSASFGIYAACGTSLIAQNLIKTATKACLYGFGTFNTYVSNYLQGSSTYGLQLDANAGNSRVGWNFAQTNSTANYLLTAPTALPTILGRNKGLNDVASVSSTRALNGGDVEVQILANAGAGAITLTLPAVANCPNGTVFRVKRTSSAANNVTIQGNAAETIDGANTYVLSSQYQSVRVVTDGTAWYAA